jgi:ATP-dependent DNA ligase
LLPELQPLVIDFEDHPWNWGAQQAVDPDARRYEGGSRWNAGKDLSFVPLRPERVVEVRYDYMEGHRFRHVAQFNRWRPDRDPGSCTFAQLEQPAAIDLAEIIPNLG